jgi:hypothetical protein
MFKLLHNGKTILRGTYRQCVMRRSELRSGDGAFFNSLTIVPCDIDADGFTGYSL